MACTHQAAWLLMLTLFGGSADAADPDAARIERVERGLRPAVVLEDEPGNKFRIEDRMRFYKTPGVSVAVIENGAVAWARGYGVREAGAMDSVTAETLFQAASISRPVAAMVALRLVEEGKIGLDEDVNLKLRSWKVPENDLTLSD